MLSPVTAHRRFLHQIPELDDQLPQTLMLVTGVLRGHRCDYFSHIPGSVYVWFDFGKQETVAFRAGMDALPVEEATGLPYSSRHPGQSHAGGNDGHTAMALSLCQWLSERPGGLSRNVLVIFQPSEETTGGAQRICDTGILTQYRVTRMFGLHLWPGLPKGTVASRPGALMARSSEVTVRFTGKSVHLSLAGEGRDAMLAAARFLQRAYDAAEAAPPPIVFRFGRFSAGTARSTVCGDAVLEGSLRTYREESYRICRDDMEHIAAEIGQETGCQPEVRFSDGNPAVWNPEELYRSVSDGLGPDAPVLLDEPSLAAEDFSFYQQRVPGLYFFLGTGRTPPLQAPEFDFDDEAILPAGVEFLKKLAMLP